MNNKDDKIVLKLFELFNDLLGIIEIEGKGEIDYVIQEVKYIIKVLNNCMSDNNCDKDKILYKIKNMHSSLYPPRRGLSEFFIWRNNFEERVEINESLDNLKDQLWNLLN